MWTNKKYPLQFIGHYEIDPKTGVEKFHLRSAFTINGKRREFKFKSWQEAKKKGWIKE